MGGSAAVATGYGLLPTRVAAAVVSVASHSFPALPLLLALVALGGPCRANAARDADREAGALAYAGCAVCHGADGLGRSDGTFPRIAGQHASVIVKQVDDIRQGRRGNPVMTRHVEALTDPAELADVAAWVASLSPASGGTDDRDGSKGDAGTHERGEALYRRDCARCHGVAGAGDAAAFVPIVAGQYYAYLLRQLRAIAGSLRRNAHPEMVDAVYDYRDDDLRVVAAYLAALPWPAPTAER